MKKELLKVDNSTIYELDHNMLSLEIEGHEPIHAHYTSESVIEDLKRNFIGCDINPRAVEITLQRLNDARS